jgi:hypothetical protein
LNLDVNLRFLRKVLTCYDHCRRRFGMLSLSMREVTEFTACHDLGASMTRAVRA